eukprot:tig00000180_g13626.t1
MPPAGAAAAGGGGAEIFPLRGGPATLLGALALALNPGLGVGALFGIRMDPSQYAEVEVEPGAIPLEACIAATSGLDEVAPICVSDDGRYLVVCSDCGDVVTVCRAEVVGDVDMWAAAPPRVVYRRVGTLKFYIGNEVFAGAADAFRSFRCWVVEERREIYFAWNRENVRMYRLPGLLAAG